MVRKSSPLDRIEKVVKRKQSDINPKSESNSAKKDRNMLNDRMLSLYKSEIAANGESSSLNDSQISMEAQNSAKTPRKMRKVENSFSEFREEKTKNSLLALKHSTLTFKDVGGLQDVCWDIMELFYHLKVPEVFTSSGISPSGGFLLHGPPGCGKTHLARAVAGELNLPYIEVAATELVCGISGESESKIRDMFQEAVKNAPCILFLDEIDAISPKREASEKGMEKRIVAQLIKCLDELNERDISCRVMVIGATNRPDAIDPVLRRGGRFDKEFAIGMPDEDARLKILNVLCKKVQLAPDFNMQWLAHYTPGYLGADLKRLITEAVGVGIRRFIKKFVAMCQETGEREKSSGDINISQILERERDIELTLDSVCEWFKSDWKIPKEELANIYYTQQDFEVALKKCIPYCKREGYAAVPDITWSDVGALEKVKETLQEAILWPIKHRKLYESSNMSGTKGILFYGPKGCGKTLLAKAIANECSLNFLSVKGPELLSMYLGESEKAVRQCFQRARNLAPCVIFFDEIDALCVERSGSNANAAAERVVNQLLTEMDGMEERKQVFVIGATNRREKIDDAMLRPGRLENLIYVGLPSPADRVEIMKSLTKNKTKPKISDSVDFEQLCHDPRCDNFSGADLSYLIQTAFAAAVKERIRSSDSLEEGSSIMLEWKHFEHSLNIVKPSVTKKDKKNIQQSIVVQSAASK